MSLYPTLVRTSSTFRLKLSCLPVFTGKLRALYCKPTMEVVVGKVDDFKNGEVKEVEIADGKKALVVKDKDTFYAVGNKCTHYGASLVNGVYCKGTIRCPWHGACFNVKTGDIEDYPGLDSLPKYEVKIKSTDVIVRAEESQLSSNKRVKTMLTKSEAKEKKTIVLIGGGAASVVCAQTLREEKFAGKIVIVSQEKYLPYDRIKLSKAMTLDPKTAELRNAEFYEDHGIELCLGKAVTSVDFQSKKITLEGGSQIPYDILQISTGGTPRQLTVAGKDLKNVFTLRSFEDAHAIAEAAAGKNVVIIGSSFIGLESATYLVGKAASVAIIGPEAVPLQRVFGDKIGLWVQKLHESKGVKFHLKTNIEELHGQQGCLKEVVLSNGTVLPADVCVLGIGVTPTTSFLKGTNLNMSEQGYIPVNKRMETNIPGVYAAGDIVQFPLFMMDNQSVNIQHWQMAHKHGKTAALSMVGQNEDIRSVPYFWTVQYGKSIRYAGYGPGCDDVVLHGNLEDNKFVAFFTCGKNVQAVASLGWDPIVSQVAEIMSRGQVILKSDIQTSPGVIPTKLASLL